MIDIDPDIEKQISLLQEKKLNSKIKEDIKKVVKVAEQPTEKLLDFFSVIADEKKQTQEKVAKSEKKISDLEELFSSLKKEKKKTKPKKKKELLTHSNYEYLEPEKEIKKEESVIEVEISEDDDTDDIIKQTTKKLSEMKVANELEKEKLKTLDKITSLDDMKKEFVQFKDIITKQMSTIGGGGEVNLTKLDDVDISSIGDGKVLKYQASTGKIVFGTASSSLAGLTDIDTDTALVDKRVLQFDSATNTFVGTVLETEDLVLNATDSSGSNAGDRVILDGTDSSGSNAGDGLDLQDGTFGAPVDLSRIDQDIVPDITNLRNLGSSTKRFNDLFLAGDTIDLAGATISSDGTGAIAISATGATLPAGTKSGVNELAVLGSGTGASAGQPTRVIPFFTASAGLNTKNTDFEFNASIETRATFTGTKTFTLANGNALADSDTTIFQF
tara:strand:+ start:151 stop:1482 length:1332 start_codon:yes stop_codon:yes gene_type:complete